MAYRRKTTRRTTRRSRTSYSAPRRTRRSTSTRRTSSRRAPARQQTVRIVLESHQPSAVQRPEGFMVAAANIKDRSRF